MVDLWIELYRFELYRGFKAHRERAQPLLPAIPSHGQPAMGRGGRPFPRRRGPAGTN